LQSRSDNDARLAVGTGEEPFSDLIFKARTDRQALGQLLEMVRPYLLRISNAELPDDLRAKVAASDVVQEALLAAAEEFAEFGGSTIAQFQGWVREILRNDISNFVRLYDAKKRNLKREVPADGVLHIPADDPSPSTVVRTAEDVQLLRRKIAELPEDYQQVLELAFWGQLSFEEIGNIMQRSPDASRMLWYRAVNRLAKLLDGPCERDSVTA